MHIRLHRDIGLLLSSVSGRIIGGAPSLAPPGLCPHMRHVAVDLRTPPPRKRLHVSGAVADFPNR